MTDRPPASHVLGPDLTAIDAFVAHPEQPQDLAGRAARALYDDVVWRLAHADLPAGARARVRAIECRAAELVVDFVRRGLPPRYFWADFAAMAHELDVIASSPSPGPAGAAPSDAPAVETGPSAGNADVARFQRVARAALRTAPPVAHRVAIAARLHDLQAAWEAGNELPAAAIDEVEALVNGAPAAPVAAARVPSPTPELAGAALRLDQAANRVAVAPLPPFVADAAAAILAQLRGLLADRAADALPAAAFEAAYARGLDAIESCLAFAREAGAERDLAARRTEALARRVAAAPSPPLLAGLLADELGRLRALMRALDDGSTTLLDFHRAFDEAVEAIGRLLAWRDAFHPTTPPEEDHPCAAS